MRRIVEPRACLPNDGERKFRQAECRNELLRGLSASTVKPLNELLSWRMFNDGEVLCEYDTPIPGAIFLERGLASAVVGSPDGHVVETLLIGRDGVCGLPLLLGCGRSPAKVFMQAPGAGWSMEADALGELLKTDGDFRAVMLRYVHAAFVQMAYTALSTAAHRTEQRLARWLLMVHDRTDGDTVSLTHDSIAFMLNVRRPSVTDAIHIVEGLGLIRATRGRIVVRDRAGLEALAASAYGVPEAGLGWRLQVGSRDGRP